MTKYLNPYKEPKTKYWVFEELAFWVLMLYIPGGLALGVFGIVTTNWILTFAGLCGSMFCQCVVLHYRNKA